MATPPLSEVAAEWKSRGQPLEVSGSGANTYIWREGSGPVVVCVHGVPASAFLYRKLLPELASRGFQGVCLDLPGLGFADRPEKFDYTFTGLGHWLVKALDAAKIDRFHLVLHDIGGPVGFSLIDEIPERVLSLTVLDTIVKSKGFEKPWIMRFFEYKYIGEFAVRAFSSPLSLPMMRLKGVMSTPTNPEMSVYGELLRYGDSGKAFLQIMRCFETDEAFEARIVKALKARRFPVQVIFGEFDGELDHKKFAKDACEVLGLSKYFLVPGKHFLQEDCSPLLADHVSELIKVMRDREPDKE